MSYAVGVRAEALVDIEDTVAWYEQQRAGLGADFAQAVLEAMGRLRRNPLAYRLRERRRNVRWLLTQRFPYRVIYQIQGEVVTVFAVLHTSRREVQWKQRM